MNITKIYFDMDGVLADFDGGLTEFCTVPVKDQADRTDEEDDAMWNEVRAVGHFYEKLNPMPGALEMFMQIYNKYGDKCEILTGIPKPRRNIITAADDKKSWVEKLLPQGVVVNITYAAEKKHFCKGPDYILIDDLERNINDWTGFGGTGILHKNPEETLTKLKEIEEQ